MLKPNWDIFRAKFNENHSGNFEWFCYLLFCSEFNKPFGVFRYKNQSAIETDPVADGENIIGWQSKFYDSTLSNHKSELIETIKKAKRDYSNITKLIFYTNQEWAQTKGKEPKGKIEVEKIAESLDVEIEWRTASFFESAFVAIDNKDIATHFFNSDGGALGFVEKLKRHTLNIFSEIRTSMKFRDELIEINRGDILSELKEYSRSIILSGSGGVGKTAVIKSFYNLLDKDIPFYIFKATEFELRDIKEFFMGCDYVDFLNVHKNHEEKIIVIDSAEKLLDLNNYEPFKEFLSTMIKDNWKIVFTTRDNYLEDLNYQFFEIYNITPLNINIPFIGADELSKLSEKYNFSLPTDLNLFELIKTPFYLSEYLKFYTENEELDYIGFKNKLWDKVIKKSKPVREQCFLKMASKRANEGHFFIVPDCESQVLDDELKKDGILGYESAGYFITHDIYEEWALEKIIQTEFIKKSNVGDFFIKIGKSLPFRRSFRKWLSERLAIDEDIKSFINEAVTDKSIEQFWKDEVLMSVMLSDYSRAFFDSFKSELLEDNQVFLRNITFILRLGCKEINEDFFKQIGLKNISLFTLEYVLTKPKGKGWESLIVFVYENIEAIGVDNIGFILPIIHDWNSNFKVGEATRFSSLIALKYYQWTIEKDIYMSSDEVETKLLQTIVYGISEVKDELKDIFNNILKYKWKKHRDPYSNLAEFILTKQEGYLASKEFPDEVLQMADLFWSEDIEDADPYMSSRHDMENYFGLNYDGQKYFPASSYQTPIFWLLHFSLKNTVDFILNFTNKSVESYVKSELDQGQVEEIRVVFEGNKSITHYSHNRLWCMYRGTQVCPDVLESIHMGLEKYLLDSGKNTKSKDLEYWLLYLLENSKSASISGVVASIVIAYPDKTFNVAKVLFKTKEFFFYDTTRLVLDQSHKDSLLMLKKNFSLTSENNAHEEERINACDNQHRKHGLEHIFLNYQFFKSEETSDEEFENRQKVLWGILDNYYEELKMNDSKSEADKTWRLYLARMDRRKMSPSTEEVEGKILISLNPEIEPELQKYSDESLKEHQDHMKYLPLKLWAKYRMEDNDEYLKYDNYEKRPKEAINEVKEIIEISKSLKRNAKEIDEESFYLFNKSIPGEVCAVLIRYFFDEISEEEQIFCKDVVLEVAQHIFSDEYSYQVSDGMQSIIYVLPILLNKFEEESERIKVTLLFVLFNDYPIDMAGTKFNVFSIVAIDTLWKNKSHIAESFLYAYLILKEKYVDIGRRMAEEGYKNNVYEIKKEDVIESFFIENEKTIQKFISSELSIDDVGEINELKHFILNTSFKLFPINIENENHKTLIVNIIASFSEKLLSKNRDDELEHSDLRNFLRSLSIFILNAPKEDIYLYLKPFIEGLNSSKAMADFFKEFVSAQDRLDCYDNFWEVWSLFKEPVIGLCVNGDKDWYVDDIIKSYLFARIPWKTTTKNWHTLKDNDKKFIRDVSNRMGHCPSTLYSISKLLNDIGTPFLDDGVSWVSNMMKSNENLLNSKLEVNSIYYLESIARRYIYNNREKIRKTKELKEDILIILDFLIAKGSVIGYMSRESIL